MGEKNIFAREHIINGIIAAPLAFLGGGIGGLAVTLGTAGLLAKKEIDDEKQREYNRSHPFYTPPTQEEFQEEKDRQLAAKKAIDVLMQDAEKWDTRYNKLEHPLLKGVSVWRPGVARCHLHGYYGHIEFEMKDGSYKIQGAILYGNPTEFLSRLLSDLDEHDNLKIIKLMYDSYAEYMYTWDDKVYVVLTR